MIMKVKILIVMLLCAEILSFPSRQITGPDSLQLDNPPLLGTWWLK